VFPTTPGAVPAKTFAGVLRTLLDRPGAPSQQQLHARSGVPARSIYRILHIVDRSVSFHSADALLVALDAIELWHQPPLNDFLPPPPPGALINPITAAQDAARTHAIQRRCPKGPTTP